MNKQYQITLDFIYNSPNSLLYLGIFGDDGKYFAVINYKLIFGYYI